MAAYKLADINRSRLENLLHRFLASARLDLEIADRFGNPVKSREWFLAPLPVIDEIVKRIQDHSIVEFEYDPERLFEESPSFQLMAARAPSAKLRSTSLEGRCVHLDPP